MIVTSWSPRGPISQAGAILRGAMALLAPPDADSKRVPPSWGDPAFVRGLFEPLGATVDIEEQQLSFEAESPEAWFQEQEENHPIWSGVKAALAAMPGEWERVRERAIECLRAGNEDPSRFRTTSAYLLITARKAV